MVSKKKLKFYLAWVLIAAAILALVNLILFSLEWRSVYRFNDFYRESPVPERRYVGRVLRNPLGQDWIRIFVTDEEVRIADRDEEAPPNITVIEREYSYRLVSPNFSDGYIDIYGAGGAVRQVRLLAGSPVVIVGKVTWYEVNGVKLKRELWPKRIRVFDGELPGNSS
jgi:hypothetical protein